MSAFLRKVELFHTILVSHEQEVVICRLQLRFNILKEKTEF